MRLQPPIYTSTWSSPSAASDVYKRRTVLYTILFVTGSIGDRLTLPYMGVVEANQSADRSAAGANGVLFTNAHEAANEAALMLPVGSER